MEDLRFSGYIYIFDEDDDDAAGVVFNYQNNKNFYVLLGTRTDSNQVDKSLQGLAKSTQFTGILEVDEGEMYNRSRASIGRPQGKKKSHFNH